MSIKSLVDSVLTVGAFLLVGSFVPATFAQSGTQQPSTPPAATEPAARAHEHGKNAFASLNLTDDQKAQIKKIHEDARTKREKVMADSSLSDTAKQGKVKEIRRAARQQAREVLTPAQREQLKANRSERRAERSPSPSA